MERSTESPTGEPETNDPIPPDAPVETPEADPRTKGAPDPVDPAGDEDESDTPGE